MLKLKSETGEWLVTLSLPGLETKPFVMRPGSQIISTNLAGTHTQVLFAAPRIKNPQ